MLCAGEEDLKPWEKRPKVMLMAMDFAKPLEIVRSNLLYVSSDQLTPRVRNQMLRLAAFKNPDFYRGQAMRLPIYNKPRVICTAEEREGYLALPRGCEQSLIELFGDANAEYKVVDKTNYGRNINVRFNGILRTEQKPAADALLSHDIGVLSATTAFGKTVITAYLIGQRKVNTLVLVHTQALLNQWKTALTEFLEIKEVLPDLPKKRGRKKVRSVIGQLGGTKNTIAGIVDIAIILLPVFGISKRVKEMAGHGMC